MQDTSVIGLTGLVSTPRPKTRRTKKLHNVLLVYLMLQKYIRPQMITFDGCVYYHAE